LLNSWFLVAVENQFFVLDRLGRGGFCRDWTRAGVFCVRRGFVAFGSLCSRGFGSRRVWLYRLVRAVLGLGSSAGRFCRHLLRNLTAFDRDRPWSLLKFPFVEIFMLDANTPGFFHQDVFCGLLTETPIIFLLIVDHIWLWVQICGTLVLGGIGGIIRRVHIPRTDWLRFNRLTGHSPARSRLLERFSDLTKLQSPNVAFLHRGPGLVLHHKLALELNKNFLTSIYQGKHSKKILPCILSSMIGLKSLEKFLSNLNLNLVMFQFCFSASNTFL
jgi:hypothetical protein